MGSRYKHSVVTENVRSSLQVWQRRVKAKTNSHHVAPNVSCPPPKYSGDNVSETNQLASNAFGNNLIKVGGFEQKSSDSLEQTLHHGKIETDKNDKIVVTQCSSTL